MSANSAWATQINEEIIIKIFRTLHTFEVQVTGVEGQVLSHGCDKFTDDWKNFSLGFLVNEKAAESGFDCEIPIRFVP